MVWLAPAQLAGAHLYPDIGEHLAAAVNASPAFVAGAAPVLPAPATDAAFRRPRAPSAHPCRAPTRGR
ncbi:hypothetical protein EDD38_7195 [Kitasatospora cineracea]|uniref:Uncharacterized protein n=1 Tax=Kitasatospora cineracea TaxID=88074 RepID=A0A3N4R2W9_9ACTN|nr:hypothetical protein EDD38_7195 [Kitasatospora cineracea]